MLQKDEGTALRKNKAKPHQGYSTEPCNVVNTKVEVLHITNREPKRQDRLEISPESLGLSVLLQIQSYTKALQLLLLFPGISDQQTYQMKT